MSDDPSQFSPPGSGLMPSGGAPAPERNSWPKRPAVVSASFSLWILMGLVGATGATVRSVIDLHAFKVATGRGSYGLEAGRSEARTALITALIGAVLYITLAIFMYRRNNWARVTLTVIGVIGLVFGAISLALTAPTELLYLDHAPLTVTLSSLQLVITLTALVLFYRPRANAWFRGGEAPGQRSSFAEPGQLRP